MSYNGSGTFEINSSGQPVSANTLIQSSVFNAFTADVASGLSNVVCKDGQTVIAANLPMGGFKHTGVANASARTDYASAGQAQDGKLNWVDGGGTADAITATYSPAITALVDGQLCFVRATAANATATPTFAPNGLTARTIVKDGGAALVAGSISGDGHELILRYDLSNTRWELLNPKVVVGVEVQAYDADIPTTAASQAEMEAGTETALRSMSPLRVAQARSVIPQNSQNAGYTCVLTDAGKHIYMATAGTFTIPANASVAYSIGTAITFVNLTTACTIPITSDTMYLAGVGTTGTRTLAQYGVATALKVGTTTWVISGSGLT